MKSKFEKQLRGTYRPDKLVAGAEKLSFDKLPEPPAHFGAAAKKFYRELFMLVLKLETIDPANIHIFENLCFWMGVASECQKTIKKDGLFYKTKTQFQRPRPTVKLLGEATKQIVELAKIFGLGLKARGLLKLEPIKKPEDVNPENDIDDFLNRRGAYERSHEDAAPRLLKEYEKLGYYDKKVVGESGEK